MWRIMSAYVTCGFSADLKTRNDPRNARKQANPMILSAIGLLVISCVTNAERCAAGRRRLMRKRAPIGLMKSRIASILTRSNVFRSRFKMIGLKKLAFCHQNQIHCNAVDIYLDSVGNWTFLSGRITISLIRPHSPPNFVNLKLLRYCISIIATAVVPA